MTLLLLSNGAMRVTGLPLDLNLFKSEHEVKDEKIKELLATELRSSSDKKKKKNKKKATEESEQ